MKWYGGCVDVINQENSALRVLCYLGDMNWQNPPVQAWPDLSKS